MAKKTKIFFLGQKMVVGELVKMERVDGSYDIEFNIKKKMPGMFRNIKKIGIPAGAVHLNIDLMKFDGSVDAGGAVIVMQDFDGRKFSFDAVNQVLAQQNFALSLEKNELLDHNDMLRVRLDDSGNVDKMEDRMLDQARLTSNLRKELAWYSSEKEDLARDRRSR